MRAATLKTRLHRLLQAILEGLWVGVIPALLGVLVVRYLVPPLGGHMPGARFGHQYPVVLGVAAFLLFSVLARYWRFLLPGGRYASRLPLYLAPDERDGDRLREWARIAHLDAALRSPFVQRRMERTLDSAARSQVEAGRTNLRQSLDSGDLAGARGACDELEGLATHALAARQMREVLGTLGAIAAAVAATAGVRAAAFEPYQVLSGSMLPTFEPGDQILGNKLAYGGSNNPGPRRGDVVVFRSASVAQVWTPLPGAQIPDVFVKRVVGLPGDRIAIRGGSPVINGWEVPTCRAGEYLYVLPSGEGGSFRGLAMIEFLEDRAYLTVRALPMPNFESVYEVQPGEVFVLGDNRTNSVDSRAYRHGEGGGVPLQGITARAQWFLVGTKRSADADLSRFLQPVDRTEQLAHTEGFSAADLAAGIASCLAQRPANTRPPPPGEPNATQAVPPPPT